MDKQKLIEELECLEVPTDSLDYLKGADYANERAISLAKQLKESKKAVLPKSADEFIKEGLSMGADKVDIIGSAVSFSSAMPTAEFSMWFKTHGELLIDALANGYEVENEPLYYVDVINDGAVHKRLILDHENGKHNIVGWSDNLIGLVQEMFTEQEIKAIDERYWPFAVKVDGE
ncbi:TPA: DUF1642 domain-containing protein [Enterococcus faecalis]|nr:DUF1642 domain-containing protein [Enterococcus faecalis]